MWVLKENLLVRIHFIIVMIRWNGLAPSPFPGSLTSTFPGSGRGGRADVGAKGEPLGHLAPLRPQWPRCGPPWPGQNITSLFETVSYDHDPFFKTVSYDHVPF